MNIYDTKVITCSKCKKGIGEIEFDSLISNPICGFCLSRSSEIPAILCAKNPPKVKLIDLIHAA